MRSSSPNMDRSRSGCDAAQTPASALASRHVLRREEMALPEFTAIAELEFPELHDESIPTLTFAKAVQRLLAASGVRDFMLKVGRALRTPKRGAALLELRATCADVICR